MRTRIAIYGGTNLSPEEAEFVQLFTKRILAFPDVVILSGGFMHDERHPRRVSVDKAVLEAAEASLAPSEFAERFETWVPSPALDRQTVQRFHKGRVHELPGTSQARRYKLVQAADALATIAGKEHTRSLLELALALEKPALPIAFTGGDSRILWKRSRADFLKALRASEEIGVRFDQIPTSRKERLSFASAAADLLHATAQRHCLVLMPFGGTHDTFYEGHVRPAIEQSDFVPHRIDKDAYAGDIPTLFNQAMDRCSATVVDLTGMNLNVLYELGHLHARGESPFLVIRRTGPAPLRLPFYLLHQKVFAANDSERGRAQIANNIKSYMSSLRRYSSSAPAAQDVPDPSVELTDTGNRRSAARS